MRIFIFILLLFSFSEGISQKYNVIEFEYIASTRGVLNQVIIKKDSSTIKTLNQTKIIKTSPEKWNKLLSLVKIIDLNTLKDLEAPSDKRFSDAALAAHFNIVTTVKKYESSDFDDGNPPKEIKKIVSELTISFD